MESITPKQAKKYLEMRFEYETELRSCMQEVTDHGVFCKGHLSQMDDETLVNVAEDLKYQFRQEFGYLLG